MENNENRRVTWKEFQINIKYASYRLDVISLNALIARTFYHYLKV